MRWERATVANHTGIAQRAPENASWRSQGIELSGEPGQRLLEGRYHLGAKAPQTLELLLVARPAGLSKREDQVGDPEQLAALLDLLDAVLRGADDQPSTAMHIKGQVVLALQVGQRRLQRARRTGGRWRSRTSGRGACAATRSAPPPQANQPPRRRA